MTRIHNKNTKIYFYSGERETVLGLKIPGERIEMEVSGIDLRFTNDIKYASGMLAGLKDVSAEFTGYYDKGEFHGAHPDGASGS
jgi:hypothetical protein